MFYKKVWYTLLNAGRWFGSASRSYIFIHKADPVNELWGSKFPFLRLLAAVPGSGLSMGHWFPLSLFTGMQMNVTQLRFKVISFCFCFLVGDLNWQRKWCTFYSNVCPVWYLVHILGGAKDHRISVFFHPVHKLKLYFLQIHSSWTWFLKVSATFRTTVDDVELCFLVACLCPGTAG